jgi:hypothetical protein
MTTNLHKRAQNEINNWICESNKRWFLATLRIAPPKGYNFEATKPRIYKAVRWTHARLARAYQLKVKPAFIPFWGGEPSAGVGLHIHALLEHPDSVCNIAEFRTEVNQIFQTLLVKAFRQSVRAEYWLRTNDETQSLHKHLNYCMRHEGGSVGVGVDKLIVDLLSAPSN